MAKVQELRDLRFKFRNEEEFWKATYLFKLDRKRYDAPSWGTVLSNIENYKFKLDLRDGKMTVLYDATIDSGTGHTTDYFYSSAGNRTVYELGNFSTPKFYDIDTEEDYHYLMTLLIDYNYSIYNLNWDLFYYTDYDEMYWKNKVLKVCVGHDAFVVDKDMVNSPIIEIKKEGSEKMKDPFNKDNEQIKGKVLDTLDLKLPTTVALSPEYVMSLVDKAILDTIKEVIESCEDATDALYTHKSTHNILEFRDNLRNELMGVE